MLAELGNNDEEGQDMCEEDKIKEVIQFQDTSALFDVFYQEGQKYFISD